MMNRVATSAMTTIAAAMVQAARQLSNRSIISASAGCAIAPPSAPPVMTMPIVVDRLMLNQLIMAVCAQIGPVRPKDSPMTTPQTRIQCHNSVTPKTSSRRPASITSSPMVTVLRTPERLSK